MNRRALWIAGLAVLCGLPGVALPGGVATDGTLGKAAVLAGPEFRIEESLGRRAGDNLFHSFRSFRIDAGESALFTGSDSIRNLIARVTGDQATLIDGLLRSEVGSADFYFINPQGVVFGANAQVDVPAGFHVGTAAELRFPDGTRFSALQPGSGSLSIAPPAAFGFRGATPGAITLAGSDLLFRPGTAVTLAGGDLLFSSATLTIPGGRLTAVAQGNVPGRVPLGAPPGAEAAGLLGMLDSTIELVGEGGGGAQLRAGQLLMQQSLLEGGNSGERDALAGVEVQAGQMQLGGGSVIATTVSGAGRGGDLRVTVAEELLLDHAALAVLGYGAGPGGDLVVEAGSLRIVGGNGDEAGGIFASVFPEATGAAGAIRVRVAGEASLEQSAMIASRTYGGGDAGAVWLEAGSLRMDGEDFEHAPAIFSLAADGATGGAGEVAIRVAGAMEMRNGAYISSDTLGAHPAGDVSVHAGSLTLDGGPDFTIPGISSSTIGDGDGGRVEVQVAGRLELLNGAFISSSTFDGSGDAGEVVVRADAILLDMPDHERVFDLYSAIKSEASNWVIAGSGRPGNITIHAGTVTLHRDSRISNWSFAMVPEEELAGYQPRRIRIVADRLVLLERGEIGSQTLGNLPASNIDLHIARELRLHEGYISSQSYDWTSPAGSIAISAPGGLVLEDSSITTSASGGNGGPIELHGGAALLRNSSITTSATGAGNGGDIRLELGALLLDNGFVQANTAAGAAGGDIRIAAPLLVIPADQLLRVGGDERIEFVPDSGLNVIQAAAPEGVSGQIRAPALTLDLSGALADLQTGYAGLARLQQDPCGSAGASSLAREGRGALSEELAGRWYGSDLPLGQTLPAASAGRVAAAPAAGCRRFLVRNDSLPSKTGGVP